MRIADVIRRIESYAPTSLAESYDNVGLLFGDDMCEITSALLTLDVDIDVAHEAAEYGANLIVSHHPLIFNPIKTITADSAVGRCLLFLAENKISVYSAHTNLDSAEGGLCDLMAAMIGIENTSPVLPGTGGEGLGRVGLLPDDMTMGELCDKIIDVYKLRHIRFVGEESDIVRRAALCSGSGMSLTEDVLKADADVYITGDIKYGAAREAAAMGLNLIEVSHYDSEIFAPLIFERILGDDIKTYISNANRDIFNMKYR